MISQRVGNYCAMSRLPQPVGKRYTKRRTKQISRTRSQAGHYDDTKMIRSEALLEDAGRLFPPIMVSPATVLKT